MHTGIIKILPLLFFALATAVQAKSHEDKGPHGHGKGHQHEHKSRHAEHWQEHSEDASLSVNIRFEQARRYAEDYQYTGFAELPKGIRKKLARGKPLPHGIAKKLAPAPMLARLPVRAGYEWRVCGRDLVLVAIGSLIISEILHDVFR